ncbi:MAG TPA: hypothetical protein VK157_17495 [Phycisphaerales bacterium]|nr:hypothetical protein [Phycisphaerales bacterium]
MSQSSTRFAQPFDLQDGLEPVVLTRTRDIAIGQAGLLGGLQPVTPFRTIGSAIAIYAFLMLGLVGIGYMSRSLSFWHSMLAILGTIAVVMLTKQIWTKLRRKRSPAHNTSFPVALPSVQVDVGLPSPAARLRVIGKGSDVAKLVTATLSSSTPAHWQAKSSVHHAFANSTQLDTATHLARAHSPTFSMQRAVWRILLLFHIWCLFFGATAWVMYKLAPFIGVLAEAIGVLPFLICSTHYGLVATMYPTVINVAPGRIEVIERGVFGVGEIRRTPYDLHTCRVTLDVNNNTLVVEDPTKSSRATLTYIAPIDSTELADFLRAARTKTATSQRAADVPANLVPA